MNTLNFIVLLILLLASLFILLIGHYLANKSYSNFQKLLNGETDKKFKKNQYLKDSVFITAFLIVSTIAVLALIKVYLQ